MVTGPDGSANPRVVGRQLLALSVTCVVMVGLSSLLWERMTEPNPRPGHTRIGDVVMASPIFDERCGEAEHALVHVIYSADKANWLVDGATRFMQECPNVQIRLHAMADDEAMATIEKGELVPAMWTPSDSIFVDHLEERWSSERPELTRGTSLLRSPVVVLLWEDRVAALDVLLPGVAARPSAWAELACAGVSPGTEPPWSDVATERPIEWSAWWNAAFPVPSQLPAQPTLEALQKWGRVDVLHATPSRSTDGALALMLLAHAYVAAETDTEAIAHRDGFEDALDERQAAFEDWLRRCEAHRAELLGDAEILSDRMFQLDAQGYDGAIVPEHLALALLTRAGTHAELNRARVIYPRSTLVMDHPVAYFAVEDEHAQQGARRLVDSLLRQRMQRAAIRSGLRPGNPAITIHDGDIDPNPFLELRRFGATPDPDIVEVPRVGRAWLRRLVGTWELVTGRH